MAVGKPATTVRKRASKRIGFHEIARESPSVVWRAVEAVAKALLDHEESDRDGVDEALGDADIDLPVFAVQRAHGLLPAHVWVEP